MKANINRREIHPASGAILMALGIFLYADVEAFPLIDQHIGWMLLIGVWLISVGLATSLVPQFSRKEWREMILHHPVRFFAMGTWVAGIFVLCQVTLKYFPESFHVIQVLAVLNSILCFLFLGGSIIHINALLKKQSVSSVHGIILLSTVTTQAMVITGAKLFSMPFEVLMFGVMLGGLFYLCGVWCLSYRYMKGKNWSLKDDWKNTNCILHGALSITGLALVSTQALSATVSFFLWIAILLILLSVEAIEIVRAFKRVQVYGWRSGLFTYDVSQWSRNFTFGMFYAFSMALPERQNSIAFIDPFQHHFMSLWSWVVILLLCLEVFLWIGSISLSMREKEPTILQ
ncbi:hypothetical protein [Guptibacillus hwajinpoensis]|uniref:hypothetical protein n=1 Tax=Guptibacillus hwajinpoensis TaxID=208199 RepID=UPI001CFD8524|nr:hypothetical protein [Pseudalkalibacillus hwajinpoensis]WLR59151.1 hypothetical protein LC071_18690 [Pseudalkalibacillus hwajinpoensis]